jgi:DnaJ family protein C protein 11
VSLETTVSLSNILRTPFNADTEEVPEPEPLVRKSKLLMSQDFQLDVGLQHNFINVNKRDSVSDSWLEGCQISCSTSLLPKRTYKVGLARALAPFGTRHPFQVALEARMADTMNTAPELSASILRVVSENQHLYCRMDSGSLHWHPLLFHYIISPLFNPSGFVISRDMPMSMHIGWKWDTMRSIDTDEGTERHPERSAETANTANESWHVVAGAWAYTDASVRVIYGRDVFVRHKSPPLRSRVSNGGEATPLQKSIRYPAGSSGVSLEIETTLGLNLGLGGMVRGTKKVSDFTRIGLGIGLQGQGLFVAFSWNRLGQNINVPIIILPPQVVNPMTVLGTIAIPWGLYAAFEFMVLRPQERRSRQKLIRRKRKELRANVAKRRLEAEQAIELMRPVVEYKQGLEQESGGLVIVKALYGVRNADTDTFRPDEVVDVTIPLAGMIDGSQLSLSRRLNKGQFLGFYDPVPLARKVLFVRYLFHGKIHEVEIKEKESLVIPARVHEIDETYEAV